MWYFEEEGVVLLYTMQVSAARGQLRSGTAKGLEEAQALPPDDVRAAFH
jgi:hypothetical protein